MPHITVYSADADDNAFFAKAFINDPDVNVRVHEQAVADVSLDPKTEILSVFVTDTVTDAIMAQLPNLKLIACRSTGTDHIDAESAKRRGIRVVNVPSYGGTTVAEYTFALLLMLTRRMSEVVAHSAAHNVNRQLERGTDIHDLTIGIVGTGAIGQGVARIAKGFGMKVLGYDVMPNHAAAQEIGFSYTGSFEELLAVSDVVSLHAPYTGSNRHLLNAERLRVAKPGIIVINTARGELIDTEALVQALQSGYVAAAGLDVVEGDETELAALKQVIITNHNAYNTVQAVQRINKATVANIASYLQESRLGNV